MSAKHTPGPWANNDGTIIGAAAAGYRQSVASIYGPDCEAWDAESSCIANARLIAAAPDLLAALQELLALHIAHHNAIEHAAARKLIRRATGDA